MSPGGKTSSGEKRGIGIPTYEDKILQRAVVMLLEPIYEGESAKALAQMVGWADQRRPDGLETLQRAAH